MTANSDASPVKNEIVAWKHASYELKSDRESALDAVRKNGNAPEHVPDELKSNLEIALEAVKNKACLLKYAHELTKYCENVTEAVKKIACALECSAGWREKKLGILLLLPDTRSGLASRPSYETCNGNPLYC